MAAMLLSFTGTGLQTVKLWRTRNFSGVSVAGICISLTANMLWLTFGILTGQAVHVVTNVVSFTLAGAAVVAAVKYAQFPWLRVAAILFCMGVACVALLPLLPEASGAWLGGSLTLASVLPQAVAAVRENDLSGLHLGSVSLRWIIGVTWSIQGLATGQPPVLWMNVACTIPASVILYQAARWALRTR